MKKEKILVIVLLSTIALISFGFALYHFILLLKYIDMYYITNQSYGYLTSIRLAIVLIVPNIISLAIAVFLLVFVPKNLGDYKTNKENREKDRAEKKLKRIENQREKLQKKLDELPRD